MKLALENYFSSLQEVPISCRGCYAGCSRLALYQKTGSDRQYIAKVDSR